MVQLSVRYVKIVNCTEAPIADRFFFQSILFRRWIHLQYSRSAGQLYEKIHEQYKMQANGRMRSTKSIQ